MQLLSDSVWTNKSWWNRAGSAQTHMGVSVLCSTFQGILLAWLEIWIWTCFVQGSWCRPFRRPPESGALEESWYRGTTVFVSPEGPAWTSLVAVWVCRLCSSAFLIAVGQSVMFYCVCIYTLHFWECRASYTAFPLYCSSWVRSTGKEVAPED